MEKAIKSSLLKIDYKIHQGLKLEWNLQGLLSHDVYFRHLILIYSDQQELVGQFLTEFFLKIKNGDYIGLLKQRNGVLNKKIDWFQKISKSKKHYQLRELQKISDDNISLALQIAGEETSSYNDPVIVNIFVDDPQNMEFCKVQINILRTHNAYQYFVTFLGYLSKNRISICDGFHEFSLTQEVIPQMVVFYKNFIKHQALHSAKVVIQSDNGQISTRNNTSWKSRDFNRIEKNYYGLPKDYSNDMIYFFDEDSATSASYALKVLLTFTTLSKVTYKAEKSLKIEVNEKHRCNGTIMINPKPHEFDLGDGISCQKDPYSSQIVMKFKKNTFNSEEEI